eukprot:Selendium_serpulae@DN4539_c0_g1_i2.p1
MMRISSLFVSSLMAALVGLSKASPSAPTKSFIHTVEFGNCVTSAGGTLTDGLVTAGVAINDNSGTTFELEFWIDPAMTKAFSVDVTSTATALGQVELFLGGSDAAYTAGIPANGAVVLTDGAKVLHCVQWGTGATNSGCTAPPIAMALGDVYHIEIAYNMAGSVTLIVGDGNTMGSYQGFADVTLTAGTDWQFDQFITLDLIADDGGTDAAAIDFSNGFAVLVMTDNSEILSAVSWGSVTGTIDVDVAGRKFTVYPLHVSTSAAVSLEVSGA